MPNLASAVKQLAITQNSISPSLAVTRNVMPLKLPPLDNISSTTPWFKRHVPSLPRCLWSTFTLRGAFLVSPCVHLHSLPLKALHPAMANKKRKGLPVSLWLFSLFDFLSIKGAWISTLLFICSSVLSIYLSLSYPLCCSGHSTALIRYQPTVHPSPRCLSRQIHHPPICLALPMLRDDLLGEPYCRVTEGGGDSGARGY